MSNTPKDISRLQRVTDPAEWFADPKNNVPDVRRDGGLPRPWEPCTNFREQMFGGDRCLGCGYNKRSHSAP